MPSLEFGAPLIPIAAWIALAAVAAAFWAWYAGRSWRRLRGAKRWQMAFLAAPPLALSLALPLLVLLNPTWVERRPPPAGKPLLTILVDGSASMTTYDMPDGSSRFEAAVDATRRIAAAALEKFDVRVRLFAVGSATVDPRMLERLMPGGSSTDLAAAISQSLTTDCPHGQALVLLSDGIHTAGGGAERPLEAAALAASRSVPIYVQSFGGKVDARDIEVRPLAPQELAFLGEAAHLPVAIETRGIKQGSARVVLLGGGEEIASQEVDLAEGAAASVTLDVKPDRTGVFHYEARVEPVAGELSTVNNSAMIVLRVIDRPLRVLVLEGQQDDALLNTLSADRSLSVTAVVRTAEGRFVEREGNRAAPAGAAEKPHSFSSAREVLAPERLEQYQLLLLGRGGEAFLDEQTLIHVKHWLARAGGALICYRGDSKLHPQLAALLPAQRLASRESRFPASAPEGGAFRWLLPGEESSLAVLPVRNGASEPIPEPDIPEPLTVVLATRTTPAGETTPAVCYRPVGAGRVVAVEEEGLWQWAFLPSSRQQQEPNHEGLWRGLIRSVVSQTLDMASRPAALLADKAVYNDYELLTLTWVTRDTSGAAKPDGPEAFELLRDGQVVSMAGPAAVDESLGVYRVVFRNQVEGNYEARLASSDDPAHRVTFGIRPDIRETLDVDARPEFLARLAEETSGAVIAPGDEAKLVALFQAQGAKILPPPLVRRTSAWNQLWVLAAIVVVWCATWGMHRRCATA